MENKEGIPASTRAFEAKWKPKSWEASYRFIFVRRKTRKLAGNQIYTFCAMMAHNLFKEIQILAKPAAQRSRPKRPAVWEFKTLDTLRHRVIQRAGLTRPQGELTLTMSANKAVRKDLVTSWM